jgi:hypothetical protein
MLFPKPLILNAEHKKSAGYATIGIDDEEAVGEMSSEPRHFSFLHATHPLWGYNSYSAERLIRIQR